MMDVQIQNAVESDFPAISDVVTAAFGAVEGGEIVQLIADLLADTSAQPTLSLVATSDGNIVGHILFSKAGVNNPAQRDVFAAILAPLAVHPDFQSMGIGSKLVTAGLRQLSESGVDLVFVLGHPGYYPKFGFVEAGVNGFNAPYPILPKNAAAWMVQELHPGIIGTLTGQVVCAHALDKAEYWQE
jgi:putative acetyltransferase